MVIEGMVFVVGVLFFCVFLHLFENYAVVWYCGFNGVGVYLCVSGLF